MDATAQRRAEMVASQIAGRGVRDAALLQAFAAVPRERFVAPSLAARAYDDGPLPIDEGQTISQPYIVALMVEAAQVGAGDTVLEVGAGSGYAAAVLAHVAARVCALERHAALADAARARLAALGLHNVDLRTGDGSVGWPVPQQRFDAIVVSAAGPEVPAALKAQLARGGRLVMPVGDAEQWLVRVRRHGEQGYEQELLTPVRFVPLVGAQGWAA